MVVVVDVDFGLVVLVDEREVVEVDEPPATVVDEPAAVVVVVDGCAGHRAGRVDLARPGRR